MQQFHLDAEVVDTDETSFVRSEAKLESLIESESRVVTRWERLTATLLVRWHSRSTRFNVPPLLLLSSPFLPH